MDSMYDKAAGSLIGLAIGDALGVTLQEQERHLADPVIDMRGGGIFDLAPGEWSDDTAMALALADSLISCNGLDEKDLLDRFYSWYTEGKYSHNGECFGISRDLMLALRDFNTTGNIVTVEHKIRKGKMLSNTSVTRIAPIAIFFSYDVKIAIDAAARQCKTTRIIPLYQNISQKMVFELIMLYHGAPLDKLWQNDMIDRDRASINSKGKIDALHDAAKWALQTTDNFKDAVLLAANLGLSSDAAAAITGQYAGALYGLSGIPEEWIEQLVWKDYILELAEKLYYEED